MAKKIVRLNEQQLTDLIQKVISESDKPAPAPKKKVIKLTEQDIYSIVEKVKKQAKN